MDDKVNKALAARELLVDQLVEECVEFAHQKIWHGGLTGIEARLAWLMVVSKLLESTIIDLSRPVVAHRMGLSAPTNAE